MKITEVVPEANSPRSLSMKEAWEQHVPESCWRTTTRWDNGRCYQVIWCCKRLDCPECGERLRRVAHENAVVRYAAEEHVWIVYVRAHLVDRLRKQAARQNQPIESVPVSDDWNAILSPYRFDGATEISDEEVRRLFLNYRISRRKHTRNGRWAAKKPKTPPSTGQTLTREFVSAEAFKNVAKAVGAKVHEFERGRYFDPPKDFSPEDIKKMLVAEEQSLRRARLKARGWDSWRYFRSSVAA